METSVLVYRKSLLALRWSYKNLYDTVGARLNGFYFHYPEKGRLEGEMRLVIDA